MFINVHFGSGGLLSDETDTSVISDLDFKEDHFSFVWLIYLSSKL